MSANKPSVRRSRLKTVVAKVKAALSGAEKFSTSAEYWENRYRAGGNSGAGSYNRLAAFKAEILNEFVDRHGITEVVEFGVGDGAQLALATYPRYTGVDISPTVVAATRAKFAHDPSVSILHTSELADDHRAELALSLDVIYHLVEDATFEEYMRRLFAATSRFVIVYASNTDSAWPNPHVRHREFVRWVGENLAEFALVETIKNRYPYSEKDPENTSFADFYVFERTAATSSAG